jgi:hemolysin III
VTTVEPFEKPRLRGHVHRAAAIAAVPAGIALVLFARGAEARLAAAVFAVSLLAVYGTSAIYHCGEWSARARSILQRLDHSMIFVLIVGSFTPVALVALRPTWGIPVLATISVGAAVGVVLMATAIHRMRRLGLVFYLSLSWAVAVSAPELARSLRPIELGLLAVGGVFYTAGAIMLAAGWPRLWPKVFSYHEVWHVMVVAAGACHYAVIFLVVSSA